MAAADDRQNLRAWLGHEVVEAMPRHVFIVAENVNFQCITSAEHFNRAKEAAERARALLLANLSKTQQAELVRHNGVFEIGGLSGDEYLVQPYGGRASVHFVSAGRREIFGSFCVYHGDHSMPIDDHMLAMILTLRHDELAFLSVAVPHGADSSAELLRRLIKICGGSRAEANRVRARSELFAGNGYAHLEPRRSPFIQFFCDPFGRLS